MTHKVFVVQGEAKEQLEKSLRDDIMGGEIKEPEGPLHLKRDAFVAKMKLEADGQELLDLMERGEWRVCERMGLCEAYYEGSEPYIDVPGWNNLVAHLRIVNSV